MKFFKTQRPKKLALYTAIILGTSIFTVACDNSKTETKVAASKPAEMSQQQLADFVKQTFTNLVTKLDAIQDSASISLESFVTNPDDQQITVTLRTTLANVEDEAPIVIDSIYLVTPDQSLQNNQYTVAKFTVENVLIENENTDESSDDSVYSLLKQFIDDTQVEQNGYVMASGDIISDMKSTNTFKYTDESSYDPFVMSILPFSANYQTKDNMTLFDINTEVPLVTINSDDTEISIKNIQALMLDHNLDSSFEYSGQDTYKIEALEAKSHQGNILLKDINLESQASTNDKGYVNQYNTGSFLGTFEHDDKTYDFSVSGKINVENLNLEAAKKLQEYTALSGYSYTDNEKVELLADVIKDGFSLAIKDVDVTLNGDKGNFNFTFDIPPMKITNKSNAGAMGMQIFNNISISVNTMIPTKWFETLEMGPRADYLDRTIKQSIEQIDAMGYDGAVTYDGKTIKANFDIKKGSVFVNGELKGSLLNTIAAFM